MEMVIEGKYNFINQPERLTYIGYDSSGLWHQFENREEEFNNVWAEVLDSELYLLEETK